ncbi:hypothetical protein QAD02_005692 [Eretmocerus hayati]|uniref:Uncharacterized protein n=1 Tax=Eretmocerus hayati TaxID=131215 RepID=A0ACC2NY14_9HYME|nr:hypothetical protein QAD02_005692 [Eretmocerus hayati]
MFVIVLLSLAIQNSLSSSNEVERGLNWWSGGVLYQIYPRSFKDSNGDGVGDLPGIISKLEHIRDIGADALWLSPIYPSPQEDSGYDISNFTDIDEQYGTLEDFDDLVAKARSLDLKVLLDFVPNHSSYKHPWFQKSINRIKPYDDYYVWKDAKLSPSGERQPPNNWLSRFGSSAWEWNEKRQQYYYHAFAIGQPDFNFRNPRLKQEMDEVLSFWMKRGVDGFRVDAVDWLFEVEDLRDEPLSRNNVPSNQYDFLDHRYTIDLDDNYEVVGSWRKLMDNFVQEYHTNGKPLIIEAHLPTFRKMKYFEVGGIPFNFNFVYSLNRNSTAPEFKQLIDDWLNALPDGEVANTPWVIGNHDYRRVASRYGKDGNRADQIVMLAMILPGIAVVYNGDEIGMVDTPLTYEQTLDPQGCYAGREDYLTESRDPARTPYQWDDTTSAGFSSNSSTWLPVNKNYRILNLASQKQSQRSHYELFKSLSSLKNFPVLQRGSTRVLLASDNVLAVIRQLDGQETVLLMINFSDESVQVDARSLLDIPEALHVYTSSVGSGIEKGLPVNSTKLTIPGAASIVLIQ